MKKNAINNVDIEKKYNRILIDIKENDNMFYSDSLILIEGVIRNYYDNYSDNISDLIDLFSNQGGFNKKILHELRKKGNAIKHSNKKPNFDIVFANNCKSELKKIIKFSNDIFFDEYSIAAVNKPKTNDSYSPDSIFVNSYGDSLGNGLVISGLREMNSINYTENSVLGIVFNILTLFKTPKMSTYLSDIETNIGFDIKNSLLKIRNYQILILMMFKNGYFMNVNNYNIDVSQDEFFYMNLAMEEIKYYSEIICNLCKINCSFSQIKLVRDDAGFKIFDKIILKPYDDNMEKPNKYLWKANNLKYKIDASTDLHLLKIILRDVFGFIEFREGQLENIIMILNSDKNTLSILPTGAGKSLIFYFTCILKNTNALIVTPTDILIEDQLRNLDLFFKIQNACAIYNENDLKEEISTYKLIYISANSLLNYNINEYIGTMNRNHVISQIIIDEVHTISNWSHDFKPEYMMLSTFLKNDFPNALIHAFTATAPYKVVNDLCFQLNIPSNNVCCLNYYVKDNITFDFVNTINESDSLDGLFLSNTFDFNNDKTVVFFYDDNLLNYNCNKLKYKIAYIKERGTVYYSDFVDGDKTILFAKHEYGIGINIPNIKNIVHYNLPYSISQYIQEVGRALRKEDGSFALSVVLVPKLSVLSEIDMNIINRKITSLKLVSLINNSNIKSNLLINILRHILIKDIQDIALSTDLTYQMYNVLNSTVTSGLKLGPKVKIIYLYVLVIFGFVKKWSFNYQDASNIQHVKVSVNSMFNENLAKQNLRNFFKGIKTQEEYIHRIDETNGVKNLIRLYYEWWQEEFIFFNVEQLIESYNFFSGSIEQEKMIELLNNKLELDIAGIKKLEYDITKHIRYDNVCNFGFEKIEKYKNIIYQLSSTKENPLYDLFLFVASIYDDNPEFSRFDRALRNIDDSRRDIVFLSIKHMYSIIKKDEHKLVFIDVCSRYFDFNRILNDIYHNVNETDNIHRIFKMLIYNKILSD